MYNYCSYTFKDQYGYFGTEFLVAVDLSTMDVVWDTKCIPDAIPRMHIAAASPGITLDPANQAMRRTLRRDVNEPVGAIVLMTTVPVMLKGEANHTELWFSYLLPFEKLGTEYFLVYLNATESVYVCQLYGTLNTTIQSEIMAMNNLSSTELIQRRIGPLEVYVIEKTYDFSGSRIIADTNISVTCIVRDYEKATHYQLIPGVMCGRSIQFPFWYNLHQGLFVRLVTTAVDTTLFINNNYSITRADRSAIIELYHFDQLREKVTSNQPVCAYILGNKYIQFCEPVEQYVSMFFEYLYQDAVGMAIEIMFVLAERKLGNITVSYLSRTHSPWELLPIDYNVTYAKGTTFVWNTTFILPVKSFYIYFASTTPFMATVTSSSMFHWDMNLIPGSNKKLRQVWYRNV